MSDKVKQTSEQKEVEKEIEVEIDLKTKKSDQKIDLKISKTNNTNKIKKYEASIKEKTKETILLKNKIFNLENEIDFNNNQFKLRAKTFSKEAEIKVKEFKDNHQKKVAKDVFEIKKYATQDLAVDIIEPLINLKLAINAGKNSSNIEVGHYVTGFEMILKQIDNILDSHGIKIIDTKIGEEFDPMYHQVISTTEGFDNKIIEIKKHGYMLHDRVIKPVYVVMGKKSTTVPTKNNKVEKE